jgi:hypothetical protein
MFSELPKLLGKNFAIGFFLPAAILFASSSYILNLFQIELLDLGREEMIPVSLFLAWVLAIIFQAESLSFSLRMAIEGKFQRLRSSLDQAS